MERAARNQSYAPYVKQSNPFIVNHDVEINYNSTVKFLSVLQDYAQQLSGLGLSKTVMEHTREWLRVKLE